MREKHKNLLLEGLESLEEPCPLQAELAPKDMLGLVEAWNKAAWEADQEPQESTAQPINMTRGEFADYLLGKSGRRG